MGLRGPAPEPSWLQLVKGNTNQAPLNKSEPKPKLVEWQEPPAYFDDEHRKVWFNLCRELAAMEVLTSADRFPLERYVVFLMKWRQCRELLEVKFEGKFSYPVVSEGTPEVKNYNGVVIKPAVPSVLKYFKPIPEVRVLQELSKHLLHIEDRFGLSPSARSRIVLQEVPGTPGGEDDSDFSDLNE